MTTEQARTHALAACRRVATLDDQKDADGFKRGPCSVGERVAAAAKEGGFLGIGGVRVSDQETAALREAAAALGVPQQTSTATVEGRS